MTYHAELAPRRGRSWLIATPLIFVLVLAVAWSGLWFYASGEAETRINAWQAQQAAAGRTFACGNQAVGGFPFRIEVRCTKVSVELKDAKPAIAIRLIGDSVPPASITSASSSAIRRAASPMACAPVEHAVTTEWLGPFRPCAMDT